VGGKLGNLGCAVVVLIAICAVGIVFVAVVDRPSPHPSSAGVLPKNDVPPGNAGLSMPSSAGSQLTPDPSKDVPTHQATSVPGGSLSSAGSGWWAEVISKSRSPLKVINVHGASDSDQVDHELRDLGNAQIAFNVPSAMKRDDTASVELLLDVRKTIEQLKRSVSYQGAREGAQVKYSDRMEARLSGAHFQITANDPEIQAVGSQKTVGWRWDVVPTSSGKLTLHLTLSAFIDVGQSESPTVVQTFDRVINVHVTAGEWLSEMLGEHWEWLATTLVIPLGALAWRRWRRDARSNE
jgi:hypothetical protein